MSMNSSFVYGYGFEMTYNDEKIIEFIKLHKDTFCQSDDEKRLYNEMLEYTNEYYDLEDFFENYYCETSNMCGNGAVVSNIMRRETGIRFEYQSGDADCYSYPCIILANGSPWDFNEIERNLSEDDFINICKKYMDELGIDGIPYDMSIEYFG